MYSLYITVVNKSVYRMSSDYNLYRGLKMLRI